MLLSATVFAKLQETDTDDSESATATATTFHLKY